jgi:HK97 family phage prohead protease
VTTTAAPVVPRFLERTVDFLPIRAQADSDGDGRSFDGYAAVFDSLTRINSWEGRFDEKIAKGAFRKSVRERMPVLQFDHGRHPYIGSMPIGAIRTLKEDDKGLHVDARLHADPFFGPLREAIMSTSIHGMSFRFEVVKEEWHYKGKRISDPDEVMRLIYGRYPDDDDDEDEVIVRTLKELKVPELGPVVFPAYPDTTASVRSMEMARAMEEDPALQGQVRASIARAMNVKSTRDDPEVENAQDADNMTTESTPEPDQPVVESEQAPEEGESLTEHSEDSEESPAEGHSEPESETPAEEGRAEPVTVMTATNLDDSERHLARRRMAERRRARMDIVRGRADGYSHA